MVEFVRIVERLLMGRVCAGNAGSKIMAWLSLTEKEHTDLDLWKKNHKCISQMEIRIVPDEVGKNVKVHCFACGEIVDITDWDSQ